ncbi:hypothetical protein Tsubulata_024688, partial [Turnera subulata]
DCVDSPSPWVYSDYWVGNVLSQSIFAVNEELLATKWPNSFSTVVYTFPLSMYIVQARIRQGTFTWTMFQVLMLLCLAVTLLSAIGFFEL